MFDLSYEQRLDAWRSFRDYLEHSDNPIQDTIDFYKGADRIGLNCDPWDTATWPTPWELLEENVYCDCCILLGICYTLALTDRFRSSVLELRIVLDQNGEQGYQYIAVIDDHVVGVGQTLVSLNTLPTNLKTETVHDIRTVL